MAKLKDLWICIDCEEVFDMRQTKTRRCPACASAVSRPLSSWITSMINLFQPMVGNVCVRGGTDGKLAADLH